MDQEKIQEQYDKLEKLFGEIRWSSYMGLTQAESGKGRQWTSSVRSLVRCISGTASDHYAECSRICDAPEVLYDDNMQALRGILNSAKDDYESGFIFNLESRISGEVLSDFTAMARQIIDGEDPSGDAEGRKNVAAVLACSALEDTLKRYALLNGLEVENKDMHTVINALKSKGLLQGAESKHLGSLVKIRDSAMHANWGRILETDVKDVIYRVNTLLGKFEGS